MPIIETLTTLRIVAGLVGVGASLYYGQDDKGESLFKKTPEAIFGQVIGGIFYDFFKLGAGKAHEKLANRYKNIRIDRNSLNHDLQKAARKAQLVATFFATQDCLEKVKTANLPDAKTGRIGRGLARATSLIKGKDSREVYLEAIIKYLNNAINSLDDDDFSGDLNFDEFIAVFDTYAKAVNPANQESVAGEFKADVIRELEILEIADSDIRRDVEALEMIKKAVENGWNELPKGNALNQNYVSLSINNLPQSKLGKRYDWFNLMCVIFNEEYKENPRVESAAQKQMLLDISNKLNRFGTIKPADYKKLTQRINTFADDIKDVKAAVLRVEQIVKETKKEVGENLGVSKENLEISKQSRKDIEKLQETIDNFNPQVPQPVKFISQFPPNMEHKVYGRNEEIKQIIEFLKTEKKHPAIVGITCLGKTSLIRKLLHKNYDQGRNTSLLPDVFTDVLYLDCGQNLTFDSLLRQFNSFMRTACIYTEGVKSEFWRREVFSQFGERRVLMIFDNFENWQTNGNYVDEDIKIFLETFLANPHQAKAVFLSWFLPNRETEFNTKVKSLESITRELEEGLDPHEALRLVREESEHHGTDDSLVDLPSVSDADLGKFFKEVFHNPQTIQSMVHFIERKQCTFREFLSKYQVAFTEEESDEKGLDEKRNKILRPAKALIRMQIHLLNEKANELLQHIAFYSVEVPQDILVLDLRNVENESEENRDQLNRLANDRLVIKSINSNDPEPFAIYSLHDFVREAVKTNLPDFKQRYENNLINLANRMLGIVSDCMTPGSSYKQIALAECWKALENYLATVIQDGTRNGQRKAAGLSKALAQTRIILSADSIKLSDKQRAHLVADSESIYMDALKVIEKNPDANLNPGFIYEQLGMLYTSDGRFSEAEEFYKKSINFFPNSANVYYNLGVLLAKDESRSAEAEIAYRKAIELNPNDADAYGGLGTLLVTDNNRWVEAEAAFNKAIELNPDDAKTYCNFGNLLGKDETRWKEAEDNFNKALKLNPQFPEAYSNLAALLISNSARWTEAEDNLKKAIDLSPDFANAYFGLGALLYQDTNRWAESEEKFKKAIELNFDKALVYFYLGVIIAGDNKRWVEAENAYNKAIELDPNDSAAYNNLGILLTKNPKRWTEAETVFNKAIELNPNDSGTYVNLGILLVEDESRWADAEVAFHKAIELNPNYTNAYFSLACLRSRSQNEENKAKAFEFLKKAIELDSKYKELAKTDTDFDFIRDDERFRKIVGD